ncbi:MAG: hypothetical protein ABH986_06430 [archaeon]
MADLASFIKIILPELTAKGPELMIFTLSIVFYGVLIFEFYHFVAKRDVFGFDIEKYKRGSEGFFSTVFNKLLGIIKYGAVFPFFVFIWFAGFALLLFFMAKNIPSISEILKISVAFVAAIRVASYYNDSLSQDMAKLIPFALLGVALIEPNFFSLELFQQRLDSIPSFITEIMTYFSFIVILEWVLRILLSLKFMVLGINKKEIVKEELKEQIEEIVNEK